MSPFFSIIIPAYNSESYIRKGLDSIRSQSFRDYELLVICDRCTDNTEQIAKGYGAITECVNYGRDGLTRDYGIRMATGQYVLFMDDDDWFLHEFCFQQLHDKLIELGDDVDALAFGSVFKGKGYVMLKADEVFKSTVGHVWSVCWKRESIKYARFGDAVFCSDTYFLKSIEMNVHRLELWDMPIYYYNFKREGSQTDKLIKGMIRQSPIAR